MRLNTCGLEGSVHVFTHVDSERRTCWGRLTDWNERRCGSEARLRLQLYGRCTVTDRMIMSGAATATDGYVEQGKTGTDTDPKQYTHGRECFQVV